jgi:beta-lactamase class A
MRAAAAGLALLAAVLTVGGPPAAGAHVLGQRLDALVAGFPGHAAVFVADPTLTQPAFARDADREIVTASLYKLALLAAVEDRVERGLLRYSDTIFIELDDITQDGSFVAPGTELTIDDALEAMVTISDNGTAVHFWRTLGGAAVNTFLAKAGIRGFHVAETQAEHNVATARAVGSYFTKLAKGELVSKAASQRMIARLERQQIRDRLPAHLPEGTRVANKTGNLPGLVHDAGIIFTQRSQRIVVAMTWDTDDDPATELIAHVASTVYSDALSLPVSARYRVPQDAQYVQQGAMLAMEVGVANDGAETWGASGPTAVGLVWELRDAFGGVLLRSARALPLGEVRSGGSTTVQLAITAPTRPAETKLVLGLTDGSGRALTSLGVATATIPVRIHLPVIAETAVTIPALLHRREASLIEVAYKAYEPVRADDHALSLGWRFVDPATGRVVAQGTQPLGTIKTYERTGTFFAPLVAPNVRGTYRLEYELRERGFLAGVKRERMVEVLAPRTFGDEFGPPRTFPLPRPTATPTPRPTIPVFIPSTSPRPAPRPSALP